MKQFYLWFDEVRKIRPTLTVIVRIVSHFPAHWMENFANGCSTVSMFLKKEACTLFFFSHAYQAKYKIFILLVMIVRKHNCNEFLIVLIFCALPSWVIYCIFSFICKQKRFCVRVKRNQKEQFSFAAIIHFLVKKVLQFRYLIRVTFIALHTVP